MSALSLLLHAQALHPAAAAGILQAQQAGCSMQPFFHGVLGRTPVAPTLSSASPLLDYKTQRDPGMRGLQAEALDQAAAACKWESQLASCSLLSWLLSYHMQCISCCTCIVYLSCHELPPATTFPSAG